MKKLNWMFVLLRVFGMSSCTQESRDLSTEDVIGKPDIELTSDRMTPEVLWAMGRVSDPQVSPDMTTVL
jgi:hypothetical protein